VFDSLQKPRSAQETDMLDKPTKSYSDAILRLTELETKDRKE
jgi:hypothetical protein